MTVTNAPARIASLAVATGPYACDQAEALAFFRRHYAQSVSPRALGVLERVLQHPGIERRHFALTEPDALVREDPDARIDRFTHWAVELSARAGRDALQQAGLAPSDVAALVLNTCTGYVCPGVSTYVLEAMGLPPDVRCYDLVGSGCGGAVPNLQLCRSLLADGAGVVLSIAVEICSATLQMGNDLGLVISNALFSDGAAAAVIWDRGEGVAMLDSVSRQEPRYRDDIRYRYENGALHNQLSIRLPERAGECVRTTVDDLLRRAGVEAGAVRWWAVHPGGQRVLDVVGERLGLGEHQLAPSRRVLRDHGNMSSPSVWFVLREILGNGVSEGDLCALVAFGAGLSVHAMLLRV